MRKKLANAIFLQKHFYSFLLVLLCSIPAFSQSEPGNIRGKVSDERGDALAGVNVSIKGTKTIVITDGTGNYVLRASPGATLVFKALNYLDAEAVVGTDPVINIKLKSVAKDLEEVVVSYGKQRSREVTGAISQVSAAPLQDMPVGQFAQQLQGKVAGVNIVQSSGQPGRGMAFRIRGAASLAADYQPLFVIDGLPITGSINNINPAEIETFTVLKDAAASALYGSRAANGVVLITTRHAKNGDAFVQLNSNYGIQKIPENKVPRTMTAFQFATFMNQRHDDAVRYETNPPALDTTYLNPGRYGKGTDWYDLLTRTAAIQSHDLIFQYGHEKSSTTVIAGYQSQEGVIINTNTKLFSLRLNQDFKIGSANKIRAGFNLAPSYRLDHNNRLTTDGVGGLFERIFESSPIIAPYAPDGSYNKSVASAGMVAYINPLAQLNLNKDDYITTRILGNAYFNYEFLPGLTVKTNVGIDKGAETRNQFTPASITTNSTATGISSSVDNYSWTAEATLQYSKTFWNDHHLEAMVGYSAQKFNSNSNSVSGTGYPGDDIPYLTAATSISAGSSSTAQYSLLSTIGRINYNYKGKYLLQGAIRSDGSSRFGANNKYGYFPSISAGWIVSDENFMQNFHQINLLKIRASYGLTGNNNIGNYTHLSAISLSNYVLNGALAIGEAVTSLGNPDLTWEKNKQLNIGFDIAFLHNRINFSYDFYHKESDGLIQARPVPRASGFASVSYNIGDFEFWGHEFTLNTENLTGKLRWTTNLNISVDRNLIKALVSPGYIRRLNNVTSDYYRQQVGHHLGEFYGFVFEGLYKDAADLASSAKYGTASDIGTIKVKDVSGPNGKPDGVIDDVNDRTFIGDPTPDFTFGLTNSFKYKNFDLGISMAGSVGGKILNAAKWAYLTNMDGSRIPLAAALDHWRSIEVPGSGVYPRTKSGTTAMGRQVNSQWVEDGSYLTVKNIALGYTFNMGNKMLLKNLRVYASVQQAFVFTKYSGMNPEISLNGADATQGIGIDENAYPVPRTFSIGLSTTFK